MNTFIVAVLLIAVGQVTYGANKPYGGGIRNQHSSNSNEDDGVDLSQFISQPDELRVNSNEGQYGKYHGVKNSKYGEQHQSHHYGRNDQEEDETNSHQGQVGIYWSKMQQQQQQQQQQQHQQGQGQGQYQQQSGEDEEGHQQHQQSDYRRNGQNQGPYSRQGQVFIYWPRFQQQIQQEGQGQQSGEEGHQHQQQRKIYPRNGQGVNSHKQQNEILWGQKQQQSGEEESDYANANQQMYNSYGHQGLSNQQFLQQEQQELYGQQNKQRVYHSGEQQHGRFVVNEQRHRGNQQDDSDESGSVEKKNGVKSY